MEGELTLVLDELWLGVSVSMSVASTATLNCQGRRTLWLPGPSRSVSVAALHSQQVNLTIGFPHAAVLTPRLLTR